MGEQRELPRCEKCALLLDGHTSRPVGKMEPIEGEDPVNGAVPGLQLLECRNCRHRTRIRVWTRDIRGEVEDALMAAGIKVVPGPTADGETVH